MIHYANITRFNMAEIFDLYAQVGWTNYTSQTEMLARALENSLYILAAFDDSRLVGLIRCVGDGVSILFIQDLLVLPGYQRQGIGRALLSQCLTAFTDCYQIHLLTEISEKTQGFYEAMGFVPVSEVKCLAYTYLRK